jgi:CBS domain-containing protein
MEGGVTMTPTAEEKRGMIECPACHKFNVAGEDNCVSCGYDLPADPVSHDRLHKTLLKDPISNLKFHEVSTLPSTATAAEAAKVMIETGHGSILLTEGAEVIGIFTERDLLYKVLGRGLSIATTRVQEVMTRDVETVHPSDPVAMALHKMALVGCRHLPVMDAAKCLGIVSIRNIVAYFASKIPQKTT